MKRFIILSMIASFWLCGCIQATSEVSATKKSQLAKGDDTTTGEVDPSQKEENSTDPREKTPKENTPEKKLEEKTPELKPEEKQPVVEKTPEVKPEEKTPEVKPEEKKPVEKQPVTKPEEKTPEVKPEEKTPEVKPEEKKPEEKPEEKKPETKPEEKKPVEKQPETKLEEKKPEEKTPETKPEEKKPETKPEEKKPAEKTPKVTLTPAEKDKLKKLIAQLADKNINKRRQALIGLAQMRQKAQSALDSLFPLLEKDKDEGIRALTATVLGMIGDKRAIPELKKAIQSDKSWRVKGSAKSAVQSIVNANK